MYILDLIIKAAKAAIIVSIAVFVVRCSVGDIIPDINVNGLDDGDTIRIEIDENGFEEVITIFKNGDEVLVIEGDGIIR